jgi:undecaprenyl-diphosphatase
MLTSTLSPADPAAQPGAAVSVPAQEPADGTIGAAGTLGIGGFADDAVDLASAPGGFADDAGDRSGAVAGLRRRVGAADRAASRLVGMQLPHPPRITRVIGVVSRSGDHGYLWYALAALPLLLRRPRGVARFFYVAGGVFAGEMLNYAVKVAVRRPRPSQAAEDGGNYIKVPATHSFPSAHATMGVVGWATLSTLYPRLRAPLAWLVAFFAFSRAYLRVHYPFDVLAGLGMGALIAAAYTRLVRAPLTRTSGRADGGSS